MHIHHCIVRSDPFPDINTERIESGDDLDQLKAHVRACLRMNSST